ncbi:phosphoribosylaminoimidazolesuccinocarboxamide synthase [Tautonia sociabilis]|uniref:phosphoribosylaminoimidazolesuccinocarboxamide synthase n=1 Tax=Tautonia sociabilis TaxID=2080755 RepID=UPI001F358E2D|nr:phosphoribosylaminoimidazolesuccinocarboxamide synthase [Tautonia sociabilis]
MPAVLETNLTGPAKRSGKVRDVYDLGDRLLIVATDRISAFDWVLPTGIPDKGRVLTGLSAFWFDRLDVPHHLLATDLDAAGLDLSAEDRERLEGRIMVVRKAEVVPFECVVRGYLFGSAWREYRTRGTVVGERLPTSLVEGARLDPPLFTPATKAEQGHDENVSFEEMAGAVGADLAATLRDLSVRLYREAADHARSKGLILADTKFEFGRDPESGTLLLVDEVLTPDSSRYWPVEAYKPGIVPPSFDKQFVRDWLDSTDWDKQSPPPPLPEEIVARTRAKYIQAFEQLTDRPFPWK